jgi:hypothetical protein
MIFVEMWIVAWPTVFFEARVSGWLKATRWPSVSSRRVMGRLPSMTNGAAAMRAARFQRAASKSQPGARTTPVSGSVLMNSRTGRIRGSTLVRSGARVSAV